MYPPNSGQHSGPPPGYYPPGNYPPQYSPPAANYGYPPQYPPPAGGAGPAGKSRTVMVIAVVLVLVVLVVIVLLLASGSLFPGNENAPAEEFGLRTTVDDSGDWSIAVTRGSEDEDNVTLKITDSGGRTVYSSRLDSLDWDVAYYEDANENGRVDTGDSIGIYSDGSIESGMKVQILSGGTVLGTVAKLPELGSHVENPIGLNAAKNANGDWIISIVSGGGQRAKDVTLVVTNPDTGASVVRSKVNELSSADGTYNDNNANGKIDAGDSILLEDTATVDAGMNVKFITSDTVVGMIKELPA